MNASAAALPCFFGHLSMRRACKWAGKVSLQLPCSRLLCSYAAIRASFCILSASSLMWYTSSHIGISLPVVSLPSARRDSGLPPKIMTLLPVPFTAVRRLLPWFATECFLHANHVQIILQTRGPHGDTTNTPRSLIKISQICLRISVLCALWDPFPNELLHDLSSVTPSLYYFGRATKS